MSRRRTGAGTVAALILACVFGASMLLSLTAGARIYRRVADRVDRSAGERLGLTYITAKIHASDEAGAVRIGSFGDEDAVYLLQELDGHTYETILYVHDGALMELFCEEGYEFDPEDGETIAEALRLTAGEPSPGLLRLTYTDANSGTQRAEIFLRSH